MEILRGVLEEELENNRRRLKAFKQALRKLLKGSLHAREIKGNEYYYHVSWAPRAKKNVFKFLEEKPSKEVIEAYREAKVKRESYRNQIRILKLQIQFLERSLHAREFSLARKYSRKVA